jgi:nicotinate-nucleotide adenylyltransferase
LTAEGNLTRVGVFGGTFDPPHCAHLIVASEACAALSLDVVLFVPAGDPWQKHASATPEQRYAMTELAIAGDARFRASRIDIDRTGPTYMVDTLTDVAREFTGASLYCILGSDAIAGMHTWHDSAALPELATFVGVDRPGHIINQPTLQGLDVDFVSIPHMEISSTDLRRRVSSNRPIRYLLPDSVADYIAAHNLYGSTS